MGNKDIAWNMRRQGHKLSEIAKEIGVSQQRVSQILATGKDKRWFHPHSPMRIVYVGLRNWMNENMVSKTAFIIKMGYCFHATTMSRYANKLKGNGSWEIDEINKLISMTGMTFEDLFRREES